jgi:hypothetical protein
MFNISNSVVRVLELLNEVPITKWLVVITLLALVILLVTIVRLT